MQLNLKKIDERIEKLQEIRQIAADPELVSMLFEFIGNEDQPAQASTRVATPKPEPVAAPPVMAPPMNEADIVSQVVKGQRSRRAVLWSRKRA